MADLFAVADTIERMASGLERETLKCLEANAPTAERAVREQLWAGLDGNDRKLEPNYDNDPYFEEPGYWHHRAKDYKAWKASITPPTPGSLLVLPARPYHVPNLFIDGTFHSQIFAEMSGDALRIGASGGDSADIVEKWGGDILRLGGAATDLFSRKLVEPWIWGFFEKCGW